MNPINRRSFLGKVGAGALAAGQFGEAQGSASPNPGKPDTAGAARELYGVERCAAEWAYVSSKPYADPFNQVELDVVFRGPEGNEQRVPAFWAGGQEWRIRYAPPRSGRYTYRTVSSDPGNPDLHGQTGTLEVSPYEGDRPLIKHGGIRVARDRRHFEHEDGTPFFWLGDTWWMGLCRRLGWPDDFEMLAADRVRKGFSVVQIVAGLYPDMPPFDPRGANEAGYPWEAGYARINPGYFDMADLRIRYLAGQGLVPCVVGCWGYFLPIMGLSKIKKHWRNIIARWAAYPVVWCLAGEAAMPYYLSKHKAEDSALQKHGWTEVAKYVRSVDPYHRPITVHPSRSAMNNVEDPAVLDFDMLQTGHSDRQSIPSTIDTVTGDLARLPRMPVLVGECCYEGILDENRQEIERFMFMTCILSGAAGHTYGANGIWQVNTPEHPYGPSPHGRCWGNTPWQVAYQLPGSEQIGHCKKLLTRYPWWRFEPHPEWVEPGWSKKDYMLPYAAGIPGEVRVVFIPTMWSPPKLNGLESGTTYRAFFFNPRTGKEQALEDVTADGTGAWQVPITPTLEQWLVVLEKKA
ncbi:MAG TPA: DUF4038 domain-containing protein [Terriglobia bacterium]|nr:DUF4038 domain-containing protein [Terriglobia bacterium]